MKARFFLLSAIILGALSSASGQGKLQVVVKNVREARGTIRVGLFDKEDSFLKDAVIGKIVTAATPEVTVVFENLPPGEYALSVIHDENENGELDSNMVGMPREGFAFGNNAMGMFGPPSFEKAKLRIENNKQSSQSIDLKYL
jgi:uncharacterized protein (DUF2141 family)